MVEPTFALAEVDACCKGKTKDNNKQKNKPLAEKESANCDDLCSPFQPCCPYITFTTLTSIWSLPKSQPFIKKALPMYSISFTSGYAADFWQPPKTV